MYPEQPSGTQKESLQSSGPEPGPQAPEENAAETQAGHWRHPKEARLSRASLRSREMKGQKNFQVKAQSKETLQPSDVHRITTVSLGASLVAHG